MIAQTLKHLNFFLLKNTIKACDFKVEALVTALMTLCGIHSVVPVAREASVTASFFLWCKRNTHL